LLADAQGSVYLARMQTIRFSSLASRVLPVLIGCGSLAFLIIIPSASAQEARSEPLLVTAEGIVSAYGAPSAFSEARFTPNVTAYVLPPWTFAFNTIYEGDIFDNSPPDHLFTQEMEMGLPHRFGIATEGKFERFDGDGGPSTISVEARYAFADWGKIPLNPTIFGEYKFGVGNIRHEEGPPPPPGEEEEESGPPKVPNAYEFRLLLADEFFKRVEWAANFFFEMEPTGDRGREWGVAQSIVTPVLLPHEQLKVGVEMEYKNFTVKDTRGDAENIFVIGPTVSLRTSKSTHFDVSALAGCTDESPDLKVFAVFSWLLGPGGAEQGEAPVSTRNR
jgi:hypothetical protein